MAATALSLPVDIPWRRLCVSEDMLDRRLCDRNFPLRWRSSLAVFSYQPPDDAQTYEGMTISYLKIVATVTGYQPDPDEVGLTHRRVDSYWNDPAVIENYTDVVARYYGCYGAIVEVAVGPRGNIREIARIPASRLPYFADFEPKKRELYELVSETGEVMSRSLENVNVRKGATTTDSHEVVDIFGGASAQASYAGTGGGASFTGQWGTKDMNQFEYTNIRTSDQARELRETFSHTTQLSQLYHQLDSYHLGTNRAVFFLVPRPHIVQSDLTFVNGPRLLEGIQELFLVVMRPRDVDPPCVEAYLETAHIASTPKYTYQTSTATLTLHVEKQAEDTSGSFGDDSNTTYAETSETYTPPDGWEVDIGRDGGYHIDSTGGDRIEAAYVSSVGTDHVTAYGKVSAWFEDRTWPESNVSHDGVLDMVVTVYIRKKKPDISGYSQNLYITGRGVCCCDGPNELPGGDFVLFEDSLVEAAGVVDHRIGGDAKLTVAEANKLRATIAHQLRQSVNDPRRYPFGTVRFAESQIVTNVVAGLVRDPEHPDNQTLADIPHLPKELRAKIERVAPRVSRGRLLLMGLDEQQRRFGLSLDDAVLLRRIALGLEGPEPEPGQAYGRDYIVPDVRGRTLDEAQRRIAGVGLAVGETVTIDSVRQRDSVINQYPRPGVRLERGASIDLVLASGAEVVLPDVVGEPVSKALSELKRAGLEREPTVVERPRPAAAEERGRVLAMTPAGGSAVTPNASVVLEVAGGRSPTRGTTQRQSGASRGRRRGSSSQSS